MIESYEAFQEYMEKAVELGKMFYNDKYYRKAMKALMLDIAETFANTDLSYRDLWSAIYDIEDETITVGEYSVHITQNSVVISFIKRADHDGKIYRRAYVYHGLSVLIYNQYCNPDEDIDFDNLEPTSRFEVDNYMDDGLLFEIYRGIKRTHPTRKDSTVLRQVYSNGGMKDE